MSVFDYIYIVPPEKMSLKKALITLLTDSKHYKKVQNENYQVPIAPNPCASKKNQQNETNKTFSISFLCSLLEGKKTVL